MLVDTERWYFEATKSVLEAAGLNLSQGRYLEFMASGRSCWDLARAAGSAEAEVDRLREQRDELYRRFLQTEDIEIPGVRETVVGLEGRYRMAIVTTARRTDFELVHGSRDLLRHFEFVLTIEDYARPKPAPDPYSAALARFGADTRQVVAIEDSARGLQSALAAGCDCLVVQSSFTRSQDFSGAWRVVDSVADLPGVLEEMNLGESQNGG